MNGYMRSVLSMTFGSGSGHFSFLKAKVNPSQKSAVQAHKAWDIAKPDAQLQIVSAHCTCMDG